MKVARVRVTFEFEYDECEFDGYAEDYGHDLTAEEMMKLARLQAIADLEAGMGDLDDCEIGVAIWNEED